MSLNQYYQGGRVQGYGHGDRQPATHSEQAPRPYGRDIPRYEPILSRSNPPQVFGHSHPEGCSGSTFSVQVSDIATHDSRTYKFVFGQRKVGAFLERSPQSGSSTVLVAQVPRFSETNWWSNRVPVYLLVTDSQTDENIHSIQICEFAYIESPTPSPLKRHREERRSDHLRDGSPIKRPNSQPVQQSIVSSYNALPSAQNLGHSRHMSQHTHREMPIPIPYQAPAHLSYEPLGAASRSAPASRTFPESHYLPTPLSIPEINQGRYIAEPQDHYGTQARVHEDYTEGPSSANKLHQRSPGSTPTYYQPSIASSPATWKSPYHSASGLTYAASPARADNVYDAFGPSEESFDPTAPTLQRTSTLSSTTPSAGGSRSAATPSSTPAGWLSSSKVKLEVLGDLDDMSRNWTAEEYGCRRRLVQFWRKQEGNVLRINFRPVDPAQSRPLSAVVISCIYWEERQECFFTSVDAIFLLESLVGNKFAVEEKNRIRRNLEGFRPLTVSKGKSDSENFFKLIMGFPAPKPRNIEKDVKAFPWRILTNALRKIIGKYSASYEGLTERTAGDAAGDDQHSTPGPHSIEMPPPPTLVRQTTVESANTDAQRSSASDSAPTSAALSTETGSSQVKPRAPSPRPLSIQVPQLSDTLPVLDAAVPSSSQFDRRTSTVPLSGFSNVDFSEFFQSPSAQPGTGSGWPSLNALFPPPSAGFGPDSQPPRKD